MQITTNKARVNKFIRLQEYFPNNYQEIVLFDIETTGFTAETTKLYLIGCCYYSILDQCWMIKQWFNDDGLSEQYILQEFLDFTNSYKIIMHYNGDGFDIPYIIKKINKYGLSLAMLDRLESIDLYKQIRSFKNLFHLDNLKQKTIESFIGINRLDKYSGGDLIKVYNEYVSTKNEAKKTLVLQHNYEDLEGLLYCCSLMAYQHLKAGALSVKSMSVKGDKLLFSLTLDYGLPKRISVGYHGVTLSAYEKEATLTVPIVKEELKFFFDNYKDYYYLPVEDMSIHKSVATYVDRNYRTAATKETCYQKKRGFFITQIDEGILAGYKRSYNETESYIELVDSFLQNMDLLNSYARYIVLKIMNCK